jgi:hypothetical protein
VIWTFALLDIVPDDTGAVWVCTVAGSPGTWVQAGSASPGAASVWHLGSSTGDAADS